MAPQKHDQVVTPPDDDYERSFEQQLNHVDHDMLRKTFEAFDADGSKAIDVAEFARMLAQTGEVVAETGVVATAGGFSHLDRRDV